MLLLSNPPELLGLGVGGEVNIGNARIVRAFVMATLSLP